MYKFPRSAGKWSSAPLLGKSQIRWGGVRSAPRCFLPNLVKTRWCGKSEQERKMLMQMSDKERETPRYHIPKGTGGNPLCPHMHAEKENAAREPGTGAPSLPPPEFAHANSTPPSKIPFPWVLHCSVNGRLATHAILPTTVFFCFTINVFCLFPVWYWQQWQYHGCG